ncbi:MAG TPA: hypothetical protein VIA06_23955 [Candidatus Dormibacteraeota bacterium]|jgi:hypothetical protein|nr:hypothetical protein [Candidatus Dormibacteraeota bacterium]
MRPWSQPGVRVALLIVVLAGLLVVLSGCDPEADAAGLQAAGTAPASGSGSGGGTSTGSCQDQMTMKEIAQLAYNVGWRGQNLVIATAITQPESGGCASRVQQGQPWATTGWGLWQITPGDSSLLTPQTNAVAAFAKYQGAGFSPWTTYTDGAFQAYMTAAAQAVAGITQ